MISLKQGKTNWKYILIVLFLAVMVGGGILVWIKRQGIPSPEFSKIKKLEKVGKEKPEKIEEETCFLKAKLEESFYLESEKKWTKIDPTSQEISGESLKEAIIQQTVQYMIEISKPLPSLKERFCKAGIARITVRTEKIDVNRDGISEYVVAPLYVYFDKPVEWDGRTINDFMLVGANIWHSYIFELREGKWRLIGDLGEGKSVMPLIKKQNNGYYNLVKIHMMSSDEVSLSEFSWNGEKYELVKETWFTPCERFERSKRIPEEYLELIPEDFCQP